MRGHEFTAGQVAKLIGVPYTTLDRWIDAGAVVPDVQAEGTGSRRRFTFRDLVLTELCRVLKEHHLTLEDIAAICGAARAHWLTDDPADAGELLISPDGGLVLGYAGQRTLFDPAQSGERDGWSLRDPNKPGGFGEIVFHIDLSAIARRMQARVTERTAA